MMMDKKVLMKQNKNLRTRMWGIWKKNNIMKQMC